MSFHGRKGRRQDVLCNVVFSSFLRLFVCAAACEDAPREGRNSRPVCPSPATQLKITQEYEINTIYNIDFILKSTQCYMFRLFLTFWLNGYTKQDLCHTKK